MHASILVLHRVTFRPDLPLPHREPYHQTTMHVNALERVNVSYRYLASSAIEAFLGLPKPHVQLVRAAIDLVSVARLDADVSFPGIDGWDALVTTSDGVVLLQCAEPDRLLPRRDLSYDPVARHLYDPTGAYRAIKAVRRLWHQPHVDYLLESTDLPELPARDVGQAVEYLARLPVRCRVPDRMPRAAHAHADRLLLTRIVSGRYAWRGLQALRRIGYLARMVPELTAMHGTEHSKEHHPEGDVWQHTLETLRYRKTPNLTVGLALLFHDVGKPGAERTKAHRFHRHAERGARLARARLARLGFASRIAEDVAWLVEHHMVPGALDRLPDHHRARLMASRLFPHLLEVYRCDLLSTYRPPDAYYRACAIYRRYLGRGGRGKLGTALRVYVE